MYDVVIIGGGIAGLGAAWELQTISKGSKVCLLEATERWGGKMESRTIMVDGLPFLADGGPDTLVTRKEESWKLASELGLLDQLLIPSSETKNIFVLDNGKVQAIPLTPNLFFTTPLLSWYGRLRLISEPFQPARRDDEDESLAEFANRRLGREASEKFIGPVLGGIYNTDPAHQSIMVSSPVMRQMEKEDGSLVLASMKRMFKKKTGTKKPSFINFRNGMEQFPATLAHTLTCEKRLGAFVTNIEKWNDGYSILMDGQEAIEARSVIIATLANVACRLLGDMAPQVANGLEKIEHKNIGTITLVYNEGALPSAPRVNGLMIPRREQRSIDAVTVTSAKLLARSHDGYALVRVFFGGGKSELLDLSNENLLKVIIREMESLLNIYEDPLGYEIFRWKEGFPQATVGHLDRMRGIEKNLPEGIFLAGSSYHGVAVPDCLRSANKAARSASDFLATVLPIKP